MNTKILIATLTIALALTGCAGTGANYTPLVDRPSGNYAQDLSDCQAHAASRASAGDGAVVGAVAGALIGVLFMAALGGSRNQGAAFGAVSGMTSGAAGAEVDQRAVVSNCMRGRGHNVIG